MILHPQRRLRKYYWKIKKAKYKRGFSIHSPFVFHLFTAILLEKSQYYAYDDIELPLFNLYKNLKKRNKEIVLKTKIISSLKKRKYSRFLFRLCVDIQPKNILLIGNDIGIHSLYCSKVDSKCLVTALEDNKKKEKLTQKIVALFQDSTNIELKHGNYSFLLKEYFSQKKPDIIVINNSDKNLDLKKYYQQIKSHITPQTILVIIGVWHNNSHRHAWQELIKDPYITVSINMYSMGLLFFDTNLTPNHYRIYF